MTFAHITITPSQLHNIIKQISPSHHLTTSTYQPNNPNHMTSHEIFMLTALISTGIFLLQFVISVFFGDLDMDVDGDANVDFDLGSLFSFKGLVHFLIGFGWTRVLFGGDTWQTYALAVLVGMVFMLVLFYSYVLAYRLQNLRKPEKPYSLVGRAGRIYIHVGDGRDTIFVKRDGAERELDVVSESGRTDYKTDQVVTIKTYRDNTYYIG